MNIETVLSRFALIADLDPTDLEPWRVICQDSISDIEIKLKEELVPSLEDTRRLEVAAAALAFYRYVLYRASKIGTDIFSAGDIQIKSDVKTSVQTAYSVWRDTRNSITDLLIDSDFVFESV